MRANVIVLCLVVAAGTLAAQESDRTSPKTKVASETVEAADLPTHYYKLTFVIEELSADGKPTNSRTYSSVVSTDAREGTESIRTGSRIPVITGTMQGPNSENANTQYQYVDVGVNIDTQHVRDAGNQLAFHLKAEITRLADASPAASTGLQAEPVFRQNMWQTSVLIPIGKPTVVFTSEALDNKGSMQLQVTATPLQ